MKFSAQKCKINYREREKNGNINCLKTLNQLLVAVIEQQIQCYWSCWKGIEANTDNLVLAGVKNV